MHKSSNQPMRTWITSIQHQIQVLKDLGSTLHDDEVILALTGGLDTRYNFLIVALDSVPDKICMIDYVIKHLINEETQSASQDLTKENSHSALNAQAK
jgi:gag-polypeptide of LTR copia-type